MMNNLKNYTKALLEKADGQDRGLSRQKRKIKWIAILGTLFCLYILSFMQPHLALHHRALVIPGDSVLTNVPGNDSTQLSNSPFAWPVDSFEQLLNKRIDENTD
ncbi:hypothetical protein [Carboxylicivirga sp. RSCT41]|uniref:hypothetical protein n=1 Tax=Carboxylicivirga agarovorans TaxID=3417570 RepID=UPI003D34B417